VFAFGIIVAACTSDAPTDVRGKNPPTNPVVPTPAPVPPPITAYPRLNRAGAIYDRTTPASIPGSSRYVIYDDGTFSLQYLRPDYGFFEYLGRYLRAGPVLTGPPLL